VSTDQLLGDTLLSDSTTRVVVNSKRWRQQKQQKQMNLLSQSQTQHNTSNATIQNTLVSFGNTNYAGNLHDLDQIVDSIPNSDADSVKFTGSPADMMKEITHLKIP